MTTMQERKSMLTQTIDKIITQKAYIMSHVAWYTKYATLVHVLKSKMHVIQVWPKKQNARHSGACLSGSQSAIQM